MSQLPSILAAPRLAAVMKSAFLVVALLLLGPWLHATGTHDDSFSREGLFKADVDELKGTQLVAHPDVQFDPVKNVLWCGTLQLTWNEGDQSRW